MTYLSVRSLILSFSCAIAAIFGICASASADYCDSGDVDVSVYWNLSQGIVGKSYEVKCTAGELSVDLAAFIADYAGNDCSGVCDADFDFDGNVDNSDLTVFAFEFGTMD